MLKNKTEFAIIIDDTANMDLVESDTRMALVVMAESGKEAKELASRVIPQIISGEQSQYKVLDICRLTSSLYTVQSEKL